MLFQRMLMTLRRALGPGPARGTFAGPRSVADLLPPLATPPTVSWRSPRAVRGELEFDDACRETLRGAAGVARAMGHSCIDPQHLILASLHPDAPGARLVGGMGVDAQELGDAIAAATLTAHPAERREVSAPSLPFTSRAKGALDRAVAQAHARDAERVTAETLLASAVAAVALKPVRAVLDRHGVTTASLARAMAVQHDAPR